MRLRGFLLVFFILLCKYSFSQDPQFVQFNNTPLYLNPANAGSIETPRLTAAYRNQWPGIPGTFETYFISADAFLSKPKIGIGLYALSDQAGNGIKNTNSYALAVSRKIHFKRNWTITPAVQVSYHVKTIDWSRNFGGSKPSKSYSWDFSSGIVIEKDYFKLGYAAHHINERYEDFAIILRKHTAYTSYEFKEVFTEKLSVSPMILYQQQGNFKQLNFLAGFQYDFMKWGIGYRNYNSFILSIGYEKGWLNIAYSWDTTASKLTNETAGSHEVTLSVMPWTKK